MSHPAVGRSETMSFLPHRIKSIIGLDIFFNIHHSLTEAETPFDLAVDFLNYWADFTGMDIIKKTDGVLITWEEMNDVWLEIMKNIENIPGVPLALLNTVWQELSAWQILASFYNQS